MLDRVYRIKWECMLAKAILYFSNAVFIPKSQLSSDAINAIKSYVLFAC